MEPFEPPLDPPLYSDITLCLASYNKRGMIASIIAIFPAFLFENNATRFSHIIASYFYQIYVYRGVHQ